MKYYNSKAMSLSCAATSTKFFVLAVASTFASLLCFTFRYFFEVSNNYIGHSIFLAFCAEALFNIAIGIAILSLMFYIMAICFRVTYTNSQRIQDSVKQKLFLTENGNPLNFKDGELLPVVVCRECREGVYELVITATACTTTDIMNISDDVSACLNTKKLCHYAVTQRNEDVTRKRVTFIIEDVVTHREFVIDNVLQLKQKVPMLIAVQSGTYIDLTTSGSILVAGKTRSGKTTAIISILLQVLLYGRDCYCSNVMIIDPKRAELSRCSKTYTLDENGEARAILSAITSYANEIARRQKILNDISERKGDVSHWWEAGMLPSFLFIDEYVALRTILPKKPSKDDEAYSLAQFDALIKRIVTMGASAGCFVIISIAEASVEEGGLPTMLKNAMSTKILLKPTQTEGRLMWDSDKLKDLPERTYKAGEAWFSSTDGIHDNVSYVHFPVMNFPAYSELSRLLEQYYL